ncbi:cell wall protein [Micromonospora sagamiensis]|uniref:Cell wall protein n=1 Tax=Micromonospora sagamiensis TaxID=47875 RepID=A0A562WHA2_9ACTN|nr:cell wall protein [Micromonospora sagamiensis]TWJ29391.1 hypothetical protein JD81_02901 [Micromonospora sagamiensis]BCL17581.1 hypothetical protein GCM10017556_53200 [Micromonospora sagamiensis]
MNQTVNRRQLLATAALGGVVGATGLGSLAPEAAFAAEAVGVEPGAPDPNFAEGLISSISGSMLMVTGSDKVLHSIRITDGTSIWKLHPTTFDRVAVGDGLYARGVRLPDGTLAADAVWVNIVNLHGHIAAVGRNVVHLDHKGRRIVAHVVPDRSAAVYNGTPAVSDLSLLRVGRHVQVLGAWHPGTNEIDIATVYAAA